MQIRQRLMISNFLMFLVPFCLILWVAASFYLAFQDYKLREVGNLERDKVAVHRVETAMRRTAAAMARAGEAEDVAPLFEALAAELQQERYHFLLLTGAGETVWSNCDGLDYHLLGEEAQPVVFQENGGVYILRSSNIVKYMFRHGGREYHAIAILSRDLNAIERHLWLVYHGYLWTVIGIGLLVLVLVDVWLARRLSRKINRPLQALREGARQVKQGSLAPIPCEGDEEFREVSQAFNDMVAKLGEAEAARQRYAQDRSLLIAGISHDIRTPLTVVKGCIEGIRDGVADTPQRQREYLDKIYERAAEMDSLVDRLFLYSKLNLGKYPFSFQRVELGGWLRKLAAQFREEDGGEVRYETDIPEGTALWADLDVLELGRVARNLVLNARKYAQAERLIMRLSLRGEGGEAVMAFADNGRGLPPSECEEIFRAFYRGDRARSGKVRGSGLGLAIAREIVAAHGGRIWADGREGLAVHIALPLAGVAERQEAVT